MFTETRKRNQNELNKSTPAGSWLDFIYSTPSSPTTEANHTVFDSHFQYGSLECGSGSNSRRHSVAFGEFDMNTLTHFSNEKPIHKRTMSLKEDDLSNALFFNSWMLEEDSMARPREHSMDSSTLSDVSFGDLSTIDLFKLPPPDINTISPSETMTHEINTMADWLLEQPQKKRRLSEESPVRSLSSSFSSPITPMQQVSLGLDFNDSSLQLLIQNYLLYKHQYHIPGERTIMLLTSKVAQKSYGTEKRFLCPPPATILKGSHWLTLDPMTDKNLDPSSEVNQSPKLTIQISGETIQQAGVIEWQTSSGLVLDSKFAATQSKMTGKCISKQLYINDADEKRKFVEVTAKVQLGNGLNLGTFQSKGIKVISKPSKKRQSAKNMELCVHHGTTISLFNRIRSQTVSTKYLGVSIANDSNNGTCFVSRTGVWDPFVIWIVDTSSPNPTNRLEQNPHNPDYPPPPAIALQSSSTLAIHYNQPVILQCVTTGLVSPVMIIRKVDKQSLVLGGNLTLNPSCDGSYGGECGNEVLGDPVSQLHKIAFQIVQDPSFHSNSTTQTDPYQWSIPSSAHPVTYLACLNEVVGMHKTTSKRNLVPQCQELDEKKTKSGSSLDSTVLEGACWTEDVSDVAVWTIVGTDCASYTFWTPDDSIPSAPFPLVYEMEKGKDGDLLLTGENLSSDLEVWFGDIRSLETTYKSNSLIHCKIPDVTTSVTLEQQDHTKKIPLLLVRSNGVVYKTNFYYTL